MLCLTGVLLGQSQYDVLHTNLLCVPCILPPTLCVLRYLLPLSFYPLHPTSFPLPFTTCVLPPTSYPLCPTLQLLPHTSYPLSPPLKLVQGVPHPQGPQHEQQTEDRPLPGAHDGRLLRHVDPQLPPPVLQRLGGPHAPIGQRGGVVVFVKD